MEKQSLDKFNELIEFCKNNKFQQIPVLTTNIISEIPFYKKGKKIKIKKQNKGKFTDYCGGKVTQECINRGKNSHSKTIRKRAIFADNARKWKHQNGGILFNKIL